MGWAGLIDNLDRNMVAHRGMTPKEPAAVQVPSLFSHKNKQSSKTCLNGSTTSSSVAVRFFLTNLVCCEPGASPDANPSPSRCTPACSGLYRGVIKSKGRSDVLVPQQLAIQGAMIKSRGGRISLSPDIAMMRTRALCDTRPHTVGYTGGGDQEQKGSNVLDPLCSHRWHRGMPLMERRQFFQAASLFSQTNQNSSER